jgi:electron-transferring-flavoprotein dehydrogenase
MSSSPVIADSEREIMAYDVLIVGAGPAGLACAIALKQASVKTGQEVSVAVLEKAAQLGGHTVSGAVMDVGALSELIPDWAARGAPITQAVTQDQFWFLGARRSWRLPHFLLPKVLRNKGNFIVSLGEVVAWLGQEAEALGVDIFPGFAAAHLRYDDTGQVVTGVITGDMGLDKAGNPGPQFQPGMILEAKYTVLAEGSRGHLGRELIERFQLNQHGDPQSYALGIKEIWEVDPSQHQAGFVVHTAGWP